MSINNIKSEFRYIIPAKPPTKEIKTPDGGNHPTVHHPTTTVAETPPQAKAQPPAAVQPPPPAVVQPPPLVVQIPPAV